MEDKKLYKSRTDKYIGGVCAGIGNFFDIDPTFIRLATVLLAFASSGIVIIGYIILCFIVPYEDSDISNTSNTYTNTTKENTTKEQPKENINNNQTKHIKSNQNKLGIFLIVVGLILFIRKILPTMIAKFTFPLIVLIAGIALVLSAYYDDKQEKRVSNDSNVRKDENTNDKVTNNDDVKDDIKSTSNDSIDNNEVIEAEEIIDKNTEENLEEIIDDNNEETSEVIEAEFEEIENESENTSNEFKELNDKNEGEINE